MNGFEWLLNAASSKVIIGFAAGMIFFMIYFAVDVIFFLTRRDFRRVHVYMLHFTRNNASGSNENKRQQERQRGGDALEKIIFLSALPLRQLYSNRFIFWRLFAATRQTTSAQRLLRLGAHTDQILYPICFRCATNPGAVAKRDAGFKTVRQKYLAVFAYDKTPGRRAYTYSLFLVRLEDIQRADEYFAARPAKGQFELFENIVRQYRRDPEDGFGIAKITAG